METGELIKMSAPKSRATLVKRKITWETNWYEVIDHLMKKKVNH